MGDFITSFFSELSQIAISFVDFLSGLFESIFGLFWVESGDGTTGNLSVLGYFLLISIATGFVIWAFNFIRSLIRVRKNG